MQFNYIITKIQLDQSRFHEGILEGITHHYFFLESAKLFLHILLKQTDFNTKPVEAGVKVKL